MSSSVECGDAPTKNWAVYGEETFPTYKKLDGDEVIKYVIKKHACTGCPMGCKGWVRVENEYGGYTGEPAEVEIDISRPGGDFWGSWSSQKGVYPFSFKVELN